MTALFRNWRLRDWALLVAAVAVVGSIAWFAWSAHPPRGPVQMAAVEAREPVVDAEPVSLETENSAPEPEGPVVSSEVEHPPPLVAPQSSAAVLAGLPSGVSLERLARLCELHGRLSAEADEKVKRLLAADPEIASVVEAKLKILANRALFLTYAHGLEILDLRPLMLDELRGADFLAQQIDSFAGGSDAEHIPFRSAQNAEELAAYVRKITPLWEISYERVRQKLGVSEEHGRLVFSAVYSARLKQLIEVNLERVGFKMDSAPKSHQPIQLSSPPR